MADADRVVVRNFSRTHSIPWAMISAFDDAWTQDEGGNHWVLKIALKDGSSVHSTATSGHPSQVEALGRLAHQHGVRVRVNPH
jgi:hypothetical protein